jgi:phosphoribulokinase
LRDKNQFTFLARQVYIEDSQSLYKVYLDATKKPHGYIILDFGQNTNDLSKLERIRFMTYGRIYYGRIFVRKYVGSKP